MVLVNALYLKAQWLFPFDVTATTTDTFTHLDGSSVSVPFMRNGHVEASAVVGDGYSAVDLPYAGGDLSMLVIAPDPAHFAAIEASLGSDFIANVDGSLQYSAVDLTLPRFESSTVFDLGQAMQDDLGVTGLFGVADLNGIGPGIVVSGAVHAAKIKVDENGTEAAAATAISVAGAAPAQPELTIRVDHPFLYVIRDESTGAVLFVGRVMNPGA